MWRLGCKSVYAGVNGVAKGCGGGARVDGAAVGCRLHAKVDVVAGAVYCKRKSRWGGREAVAYTPESMGRLRGCRVYAGVDEAGGGL